MVNTLSREPVLIGDTYCSPACGFRCTKAAYDEACAKGEELATQLGSDWKSDVWENCAWHYAAQHTKENIRVYYHSDDGYTCYYNGPKQQVARAADPVLAFNAAVDLMKELREDILVSLQKL